MVTTRPSQLSRALGVPAEMRRWDRSWGPALGRRIDEPTGPQNQAQNDTGGSCPFSRTPEVSEGVGKAHWSRIRGHGEEKLISLAPFLALEKLTQEQAFNRELSWLRRGPRK